MASSKSSHTLVFPNRDIKHDNNITSASDDGSVQETPTTQRKVDDTFQEQSTANISFLLVALLLSMFLVGLDRTIISTAIPKITDDFNSFSDVGWYGAAYLLTCCAFQLQFGKIYTYFPIKAAFLSSILVFEVGSIVCGAAPTSTAFIIGRAFSGIGAAGIFAGSTVALVYAVPLEKRPKLQGAYGALFGLSSIIGPIIGGAFTSHISWRWCFYINLPIGGIAVIAIYFFLKIPNRETENLPLGQKLLQLDILGTVCLVPAIICLVLALQWGGQKYAWSDGRIIALLTAMGLLTVACIAIQILLPQTALAPPRIFTQRSILAGWWQTFMIGASQYIIIYYLPIWFQAIKGVSASQSGIRLLPTMLSLVVGSIFAGLTVQKIGWYTPFAMVGVCIMSVGSGLLYTLQVDTGVGKWLGYQIIYGFGMGLCFQQPNLAAQTVVATKDVPSAVAIMFFAQLVGAAIFVPVGENILGSQLLKKLSGKIPGATQSLVTSQGVTSLLDSLPEHMRELGLVEYNEALRQVFLLGLVLSCLSVPGAFALEFKSTLKEHHNGLKDDEKN